MNTQQESKQTSRIMKTIEALTDNLENSRLDPEKISQSATELDELAAFMEGVDCLADGFGGLGLVSMV